MKAHILIKEDGLYYVKDWPDNHTNWEHGVIDTVKAYESAREKALLSAVKIAVECFELIEDFIWKDVDINNPLQDQGFKLAYESVHECIQIFNRNGMRLIFKDDNFSRGLDEGGVYEIDFDGTVQELNGLIYFLPAISGIPEPREENEGGEVAENLKRDSQPEVNHVRIIKDENPNIFKSSPEETIIFNHPIPEQDAEEKDQIEESLTKANRELAEQNARMYSALKHASGLTDQELMQDYPDIFSGPGISMAPPTDRQEELYTRQQVIEIIDDLLQRPDLITDAISNEDTNYGPEDLLIIAEKELQFPRKETN